MGNAGEHFHFYRQTFIFDKYYCGSNGDEVEYFTTIVDLYNFSVKNLITILFQHLLSTNI